MASRALSASCAACWRALWLSWERTPWMWPRSATRWLACSETSGGLGVVVLAESKSYESFHAIC